MNTTFKSWLLGDQGTVRRDMLNAARDCLAGWGQTAERKSRCPWGQELSHLEGFRPKRSETLFILGSGASVAGLSKEDFVHIGHHDSLGLNHWPLHDFVPSYLLFEASSHKGRLEALLKTLSAKSSDYSTVPMIVDYRSWRRFGVDAERVPDRLRKQFYWHVPWWLASIEPAHVRFGLSLWNSGIRRSLGDAWRLVHHRGGLSAAVSFAYLSGYRQIVLVGVDLNDSRFFWEVTPEAYDAQLLPPRTELSAVHSSVDPLLSSRHHTLPMDEFLMLFAKTVLEPSGITLSHMNPGSRLFGRLPLYRSGRACDTPELE